MRAHAATLSIVAACSTQPTLSGPPPEVLLSTEEIRLARKHSPLRALPVDPSNSVADDPRAAKLGKTLFFDRRFSAGERVSCATCHDPGRGFTTSEPFARGLAVTMRNPPSLWNAGYNRWFFWDGRADSQWAQALQPLEAPDEHGSSRTTIARIIAADARLRADYEAIFGPLPPLHEVRRFPPGARPAADDPAVERAWLAMTDADRDTVNRVFANVGKALAAYQRTLVSRRSRFDVFIEGIEQGDPQKARALTPAAQRGLKLFLGRGQCNICHHGSNFTDGEFHDIGLPLGDHLDPGRYGGIPRLLDDPFNRLGAYTDEPERGREAPVAFVVRRPSMHGEFKTPSLRNVARTAPYMHDGRFATLRDVLHFYSVRQGMLQDAHPEAILQPLELTDGEVEDLVAFLESLTDENVWTGSAHASR